MPFDDKTLKRDGSGITPVPQHFNPIANDYEPVYGRNNASRVELYGADGNPISASSGKLAVRATEIESLLNDIKGKDYATQTTVAAILNKIISAPATEAKQDALNALIGEVQASPTANTLLARLKNLEDKIAAIDSVLDAIVDGSTPAVTQLSGSNIEQLATNYGKIKIETLINAIPVVAGGRTPSSAWVNYRNEGASQVWVMINIDKYPWTLETGQGVHYNEGVASGRAYPLYINVNKAYAATHSPATAILLPFQIGTSMGLPESLTWTEALQFAGPLYDGQQITIKNNSTETATITVRIVKIWR